MFLCFGFTKVPNNMILMSHHCIDPYYCTTLCVHVLQRVGGPGEPRALVVPIIFRARNLFCRSRDKERWWEPTDPTSVDGRPGPTRFVEPFLEILAES